MAIKSNQIGLCKRQQWKLPLAFKIRKVTLNWNTNNQKSNRKNSTDYVFVCSRLIYANLMTLTKTRYFQLLPHSFKTSK